MASSKHESRSILDDRVYVCNASRSPRYVAFLPLAPPILRNHEQDETTGHRETREPLGIRDEGGIPRDPEGEMRELDQESRVASIAGQKLNVARFELLRLKM